MRTCPFCKCPVVAWESDEKTKIRVEHLGDVIAELELPIEVLSDEAQMPIADWLWEIHHGNVPTPNWGETGTDPVSPDVAGFTIEPRENGEDDEAPREG